MKINVDNEQILDFPEWKIKCIQNDISASICKDDMCRRVKHVLEQKYEHCFKRLKEEWEVKLKKNGVRSVPLDEEEFCNLVFAQPNYKDREAREQEEVIAK